MSKSLGNVINPIDTIRDYGTDALRFSVSLGTAGQVMLCPHKIAKLQFFWLIVLIPIYDVNAGS